MIPVNLKGTRIKLTYMGDDPDPIPVGSEGTVVTDQAFTGDRIIKVNWDCKRTLNLVCPPDLFEVIETEELTEAEEDKQMQLIWADPEKRQQFLWDHPESMPDE